MTREFPTITAMADAVIAELQKTALPFAAPTVVFHNAKIAQWFKAYYLKKSNRVLMNVRFETLGRFINGLINPAGDHEILSRSALRDYILKVLTEQVTYDPARKEDPMGYIFEPSGKLSGTNLYEFADTLATLFMNYEYDEEDITGWQKDIYEAALTLAAGDHRYTAAGLFRRVKGTAEFRAACEAVRDGVWIVDNSYISALYGSILGELDSERIAVFSLARRPEGDKPLCQGVLAAPSVQREVEAIHSEICTIVQKHPTVRYNDFLVLVPGMDSYANTIERVFRQDDRDFPAIPYRIVGSHKEQRDMISALEVLCDIARKRYFTRFDFHRFVGNPMVKYVRGITEEETAWWMDAIDGTNTYRNAAAGNDWDYLKKRLLLSRLVAGDEDLRHKTDLDGEAYLPYQLMDMGFDSVNRLIDVLDDLLAWCGAFTAELNDIPLAKKDLERMEKLLDGLFSKKGSDGEETNYLYRTVLEENRNLMALDMTLPANTWLRLLQEAPRRYMSHPADMFVGGVTFLELSADNIVTEPYIFVMGMSSRNFPRVEVKSELDLSKNHRSTQELDRLCVENLCAGGENRCVFSYVERDLKKDSKFYPTSLMPELPAGQEPRRIPLDEKRSYEDLYTRKEFINKAYFENLTDTAVPAAGEMLPSEAAVDTELRLSDLRDFLKNTYVYRFTHLLEKRREDEEVARDAYEPIDVTNLKRYNVTRELIKSATGEEKERQLLKRTLPAGELGEMEYARASKNAEKTRALAEQGGYALRMLPPLELCACDEKGDALRWQLMCKTEMFCAQTDGELHYLTPTFKEDSDVKKVDFLEPYVFSLMDVGRRSGDTEYSVCLHVMEKKESYRATPAAAREILNGLFLQMNDYSDLTYMDFELLCEMARADDPKEAAPKDVSALLKKAAGNGGWKYFADADMISPRDTFDAPDLQDRLVEAYGKVSELVLFVGND